MGGVMDATAFVEICKDRTNAIDGVEFGRNVVVNELIVGCDESDLENEENGNAKEAQKVLQFNGCSFTLLDQIGPFHFFLRILRLASDLKRTIGHAMCIESKTLRDTQE